jgi:hypothetical protein
MARAYGLDSGTEGGMLDHKIRSPPSLPYHLDFMVGFDRGASSMVQQKHFTKFSVNFTQIYYISNKNSPTRGGRGGHLGTLLAVSVALRHQGWGLSGVGVVEVPGQGG